MPVCLLMRLSSGSDHLVVQHGMEANRHPFIELSSPGFLVAYALQTETFYDILGGVNFLALALWYFPQVSEILLA